ncbi:MAG: nucleotide exchange factor GrpE [Microscillaceae bacterium]|nr:nucleotide exchange factor GrpE [Microscillaceae bacterium]
MTTNNQENKETILQSPENAQDTQNTETNDAPQAEDPASEVIAEEASETTAHENKSETQPTEEPSEVDLIQKLQSELNEQKDKYVRLYAEFENFRRRSIKEKSDTIRNASESLIKELLPIIDDFERALKSMQNAQTQSFENKEDTIKDIKAVEEGIVLIYNKMFKTLESKGLKIIESAIGKDFNLEEHESITTIPAPSEDMKGKVIDEIEKGYYLHDKVLRFTKVILGS